MFENNAIKQNTPLILVCDEKDIAYANYLIQLIGQNDDEADKVVGIADDSVSAAIYTTKFYKDNLPNIPSTQRIIFIGQSPVAKEQRETIMDKYEKLGMHYGWLGKRAVLYVDDTSADWMKLKDDRKHYDEFLTYSKEHEVTETKSSVIQKNVPQMVKKLNKTYSSKAFVKALKGVSKESRDADVAALNEIIEISTKLKNIIEAIE